MAFSTTAPKSTFNLPVGRSCCDISIIDSTCDSIARPQLLVEPTFHRYAWLNLPTWVFHIKHVATGRQVVFDLGGRKDLDTYVPAIRQLIQQHVPGFKTSFDVVDILHQGGVNPESLEAVILSHSHPDHAGSPQTLPQSVKLVVGPGFKQHFMPGYPSNTSSVFSESDFENREIFEIQFTEDTRIGSIEAFDYFGDGSLHILNLPGHAVAHIGALVRTTFDSFILLAGDTCHTPAVLRPSEGVPMPNIIPEACIFDDHVEQPCYSDEYMRFHYASPTSTSTPFFRVPSTKPSYYDEWQEAQDSVEAIIDFDCHPDVLVIIAHDPSPRHVCDFFPYGTLNNWRENGWKTAMHWGFLNEFPYREKEGQPLLVDGLYSNGKKLRGIDI